MKHPSPNRRSLMMLVVVAACVFPGSPAVLAAPPPIPPRINPPARVGRLAQLTGAVSYHSADADRWGAAIVNLPVTSGDAFWTEPGARAVVAVAANRFSLDQSTEFEVTSLDDHALVATEPQGALCIRLAQVTQGDSYSVQTPRGVVQITTAGQYEVVSGDVDHPTTVTVVEGAAQVTGTNLSMQLGPRQTASITGAESFTGVAGPMQSNPFLTACLAAQRPASRPGVAPPPLVQTMTGADELADYGEWQATPDYGTVWYPQVEPGWVPYREGRWSYVAAWGWTWVDAAPWGFAPFHYGRWIQRENRWGWIPAEPGAYAAVSAPVYAPALVTFVQPLSRGTVGWLPLGPNEPYYPPFRANADYVRNVNRNSVVNVNQVITDASIHTKAITNNRVSVQNFANRQAATVLPVAAMVSSQPVAQAAQAVPVAQTAQLRSLGRLPLTPRLLAARPAPSFGRPPALASSAANATAVPGPAFQRLATHPTLPPLREHALPQETPALPSPPAHAQGRPPEASRPPVIGQPSQPTRPQAPVVVRPAPPFHNEPPRAAPNSYPMREFAPLRSPPLPHLALPHLAPPRPEAASVPRPPAPSFQRPAPALMPARPMAPPAPRAAAPGHRPEH